MLSLTQSLLNCESVFDEDAVEQLRAAVVSKNARLAPFVGAVLLARAIILNLKGAQAMALAGFDMILRLDYLLPYHHIGARIGKGQIRRKRGQLTRTRTDLTFVIDSAVADSYQRGEALYQRSYTHYEDQKPLMLADITAALDLIGERPDRLALTVFRCAELKISNGDIPGAIAVCEQYLRRPELDIRLRCQALLLLGSVKAMLDEDGAAIATFNRIVSLPNAARDDIASAILGRARVNSERGQMYLAIADCTAVLRMHSISADPMAEALSDAAR
jgi:hypothetical protein